MSLKPNKTGLQAELAVLLDHDTCVPISEHDRSSLRSGTFPRAKLESLVSTMQQQRCGWTHTSSVDPKRSSRLNFLPSTHFKVLKIDSTNDAIFHAFLEGLSLIVHGHTASARTLKASTAKARAKVVRLVLQTKALQNAMARDPSRSYQRQFEARSGAVGKRSYIVYSQKMLTDAVGSYTELAALSRVSGIEIHVYERHANGYRFVLRYLPGTRTKKRYVLRVLRSPRTTVDHFDVLVQAPFLKYPTRGFWDHVNRVLLGKLGGNAINSPEKALALMNQSRNVRSKSNLPNENASVYSKNFNWNASPSFTAARGPKTPAKPNTKNRRASPNIPNGNLNDGGATPSGRRVSSTKKLDEVVADHVNQFDDDEVRNALKQLARNG